MTTPIAHPYTKRNVKEGILHFLLGRGMAAVAGLATVLLLVRYMEVKHYAAYTALSGLIAFAGVLSGLGLERVITRYVPEGRVSQSAQRLARFIWQITAIRCVIVSLMVFCIAISWPWLLQLFKDVQIPSFPIALGAFIVGEALFQHFAVIFQSLVQQKILTRIMIIQWAGRLILLVYMVVGHNSLSLNEALWVMAIPEVLAVIVFVVITVKLLQELHMQMKSQTALDGPWPAWQEVYHTAKHNYHFQLLASPPQSYMVKMLIATCLPTHAVAAYGFFSSLAERFRQYIPLHLFYNLIEPVLIGQYLQWKDFDKLNARAQWLYKSNLLVLVPIIIALLVLGSDVTSVITQGKFTDMNWILILVLIQLTIGSHVNLLQMVSNAVGKSDALSSGGLLALIILLCFWALVIPFQPYLIFVGPLLYSLVCNQSVIRALNNAGFSYKLHIHSLLYLLMSAALAGIAGEGMRFFLNSIMTPLMIQLVLNGLFIVVVFWALAWRLGGIQKDEISQLRLFLKPS